MNRLTEKNTNYNSYFPKNKVSILDLSNKLGKLEDLEEELGCTFETIIEAATNGIIDSKGKLHEVVFDHRYLYVVEEDELIDSFDYKDYKKTWWLPSDEKWRDVSKLKKEISLDTCQIKVFQMPQDNEV